jgi:hypothetical protein
MGSSFSIVIRLWAGQLGFDKLITREVLIQVAEVSMTRL